MALIPNTNLFLLKCPLQLSNVNQLTFSNVHEQFKYFASLPYLQIDNISYQRKDNIIRFPGHIDQILEYNYVMYQNENYATKWFYAFIVNMTYVNDNRTDIQIATDCFQTWQFDLHFKESFIEREMINVSEDIPGANLIPEGLETGEFITTQEINIPDLDPIYVIAFTGDKIGTLPIPQEGYRYNGIYSSITFIITTLLKDVLNKINEDGNGDKIFTVFTIPQLAVKKLLPENPEEGFTANLTYNFNQEPILAGINARPDNLDGYLPNNKKLFTYPYIYLGFNPHNGSQKIFRFENFSETPSFKIISEINPNPTICMIPQNFKNIENNIPETVTISGYPNISYKNEYFNTWLAQNQNIVQLQMDSERYNYSIKQLDTAISGLGGAGGSALQLNPVGVISNLASMAFNLGKNDVQYENSINQQMAQVEKQQMLPDTANLSNSNSTMLGYKNFSKSIFCTYTIKKQFAERIDKYFDVYGYKTNLFKIPNLKNRPNWNYIKTSGLNILANIPQQDLQIIKDIFNSGITLWHNPNTFLDYSQNNR